MKRFGSQIKSEITKKQVNVIYSANKRGNVQVAPTVMTYFYDHIERSYTSLSDNDVMVAVIDQEDAQIKAIIDAIFKNDFAKAQEVINEVSAELFTALREEQNKKARKKQAKTNGSFKPRFA